MNLLSPIRRGVDLGERAAVGAVRLAAGVPRFVRARVTGNAAAATGADAAAAHDLEVTRNADRAETQVMDTAGLVGGDTPAADPDPVSAAGASTGVGGTLDAPGDAAEAGAPDPTGPSVPQGERRAIDMEPVASSEPAPPTLDGEDELVYSTADTDADPSATLRVVDPPWEGYDAMRANEVVARLKEVDESTRAVALLYEQSHRARKRVLEAAR
jgi:hypothetical protein